MDYPIINKMYPSTSCIKPNLADYAYACRAFSWNDVRQELDGFQNGGLNIAYEAIDRHAQSDRKDKIAMYWEGKNGEEEQYTFSQLAMETNKFANALKELGVRKGDRIFLFLDRIPELYIAFFGVLKIGGIVGPLFSAFGPNPVRDRLKDSGASVLVTQPHLRQRITPIIKELTALKHTIVINKNNRYKGSLENNDYDYDYIMAHASARFAIEETTVDDPAIIHYTSGTTGRPKGAVHAHGAVLGHYITGKWVLDFKEHDVYFCTADPGWVTGTSYGMSAPWTNGITQVIYEGGFGAGAWYRVIQKYKVTIWYTAPTAIRMLMKAGERVAKNYHLNSLRHICSVGEPLNPEAIVWGLQAFNLPIHDNWWQTETGCILIANYLALPIHPGSMGFPLPGITARILDDQYQETPIGHEGHLAIKPGWPSMFRTYWNNADLYESRFQHGWYITGDRARLDHEGRFWFIGRTDDVINTAGHLVGPFEVESVLIEHPSVTEAGVIGKPDPIAMEVVKAFVSLAAGYHPTEELRRELIRFCREKLAAAATPREISFLPNLPKTRSGKIMRRLLKARDLGLPEGDTSTLEDDPSDATPGQDEVAN